MLWVFQPVCYFLWFLYNLCAHRSPLTCLSLVPSEMWGWDPPNSVIFENRSTGEWLVSWTWEKDQVDSELQSGRQTSPFPRTLIIRHTFRACPKCRFLAPTQDLLNQNQEERFRNSYFNRHMWTLWYSMVANTELEIACCKVSNSWVWAWDQLLSGCESGAKPSPSLNLDISIFRIRVLPGAHPLSPWGRLILPVGVEGTTELGDGVAQSSKCHTSLLLLGRKGPCSSLYILLTVDGGPPLGYEVGGHELSASTPKSNFCFS